jgi:Ulp1 protease family, C-terminal catalytic domain
MWTYQQTIQSPWRKSCQWLDNEENKMWDLQTINAVCTARQILNSLAWNVRLTYLQGTVTSAHLAQLLGTTWLNDDHIDMMIEDLSKEVTSNPGLAEKVIIAKLSFAQQVLNVNGKYMWQTAPLLCHYEKHIKENDIEELYFPIHVNTNHWIAGLIHLKNHTISFSKFSSINCIYMYSHQIQGDLLNDTFILPK